MPFPPAVVLTFDPSVSNVFEYVYEPRNCSPWVNRLVRLASSPLYHDAPADSICTRLSGGKPRNGSRWGMLATVLAVIPRIGLPGLAERAWSRDRWLTSRVPRVPTYPTSSKK